MRKILILVAILVVSALAGIFLSQKQKLSLFTTKPQIGEKVLGQIVDPCLWKNEAVCQNGETLPRIYQPDIINNLTDLQSSLLKYEEGLDLESFDTLVNWKAVVESGKRDNRDLHIEYLRRVKRAFASDAFYLSQESFKINWRILAGLGETISGGLTLASDDRSELSELDFLDQKISSLVEQLYNGSLELVSYKAKYDELLENQKNANEIKLSNGNTYPVKGGINSESLAVYDYLAKHLTQEEFEVAAFGTGRSENLSFAGRYKSLFNDDPRDP